MSQIQYILMDVDGTMTGLRDPGSPMMETSPMGHLENLVMKKHAVSRMLLFLIKDPRLSDQALTSSDFLKIDEIDLSSIRIGDDQDGGRVIGLREPVDVGFDDRIARLHGISLFFLQKPETVSVGVDRIDAAVDKYLNTVFRGNSEGVSCREQRGKSSVARTAQNHFSPVISESD